MNCNKCGKEINSGVWAAHKKIPKLDYAFCGRCWYYDKNPNIAYNGNIEDPRDKKYKHHRSRFHDSADEPFIISTTPIIYKIGDVEKIELNTPEDKLEFFGKMIEYIGLGMKDNET